MYLLYSCEVSIWSVGNMKPGLTHGTLEHLDWSPALILLLASCYGHPGRQQVIAQALGPLPTTGET